MQLLPEWSAIISNDMTSFFDQFSHKNSFVLKMIEKWNSVNNEDVLAVPILAEGLLWILVCITQISVETWELFWFIQF